MDATPAIHFDEDAHVYLVDGQRYPSVTEILGDLSAREYRFVDRATMEAAAELGTAVHKMIELDVRRVLDEDSLDTQLVGYLAKWRQFLAQSGFRALLSEERVYSRKYRYAGTLDLFGVLNGEAALIDAKRCASVPRTAGPQTAGYEVALRECRPEIVTQAASGAAPGRIQRFALHLTPSESPGWSLVPFKSPNDQRVFLSALTLSQWSNAA